jgi:hypothetical protein
MIAKRILEFRPAHNAVRAHGSTDRSRDIRMGEAEHVLKAEGAREDCERRVNLNCVGVWE